MYDWFPEVERSLCERRKTQGTIVHSKSRYHRSTIVLNFIAMKTFDVYVAGLKLYDHELVEIH